ncbi:hypothetical protein Tco_0909292 [Tanacetum coccineum]|uniref:Uncharacterized protein n=1 Tax=Tanacetum coccineum TaxID=301880 RepID=A0ABQ5CRK7_9ASTR
MVLMVERNCGEHLIRRFTGRGNEPDPCDKLGPTSGTMGQRNVNPFGVGNPGFHDDHYDNPLLINETESEPIIWDIGDEEEEYPFVNKYPNTDIEDVIEEEQGFVGKGGFGREEDNIEDIVVVANDLCSSMIQTILSVDFEEDINTKSHELMSFEKSIIIKALDKIRFESLTDKSKLDGQPELVSGLEVDIYAETGLQKGLVLVTRISFTSSISFIVVDLLALLTPLVSKWSNCSNVTQLELHHHFHSLMLGVIEDVWVQHAKAFGFIRYSNHTEFCASYSNGEHPIYLMSLLFLRIVVLMGQQAYSSRNKLKGLYYSHVNQVLHGDIKAIKEELESVERRAEEERDAPNATKMAGMEKEVELEHIALDASTALAKIHAF